MKRTRNTRTSSPRRLSTVDKWSLRAVVILQGIAIILGIIAGTQLENSTAVLEGFLKILELVTRVS